MATYYLSSILEREIKQKLLMQEAHNLERYARLCQHYAQQAILIAWRHFNKKKMTEGRLTEFSKYFQFVYLTRGLRRMAKTIKFSEVLNRRNNSVSLHKLRYILHSLETQGVCTYSEYPIK